MAYPTVAGSGGEVFTTADTSTTIDLTKGGTPSDGDLLLIVLSFTLQGTSVTWSNGVTAVCGGYRSSGPSQYVGSLIWHTGDSTSASASGHVSSTRSYLVVRISGGAAVCHGDYLNNGSSLYPDPISLTPSWGAEDNLYIATCANSNGYQTTAAPTNYTGLSQVYTAGYVSTAFAYRQTTASPEDPATFTIATSGAWVSWTLCILPAGHFPTLAAIGGSNSGGNVTTSSVDVTIAGTPQAGDLVIIAISKDGTGTFTWPATPAFTSLLAGTAYTSGLHEIRYRIWQAGDSTTVSITHATESTAWEVVRIAKDTFDSATAPYATGTTGDSSNPNPPSGNPDGWDVEKTLWIAEAANDGNVAITTGPSGYYGFRNDRVAASTGQGIAIAWKASEAASEDPGTFTMSTEQWGAGTIAIRPATGTQSVTGTTISSGASTNVPTVAPGAVGVTGSTIPTGSAATAPNAAYIVAGAALVSGAAVYEPSASPGAVAIEGATLPSSAATYDATVTPGAVAVGGDYLASSETLNVPTFAYHVAAAFIASALSLFAPEVAPGAVAITVSHIATTEALYEPSVAIAPVEVVGEHVASSETLYAPSLIQQIAGSTIGTSAVLHAPIPAYAIKSVSISVAPRNVWTFDDTEWKKDNQGDVDLTETSTRISQYSNGARSKYIANNSSYADDLHASTTAFRPTSDLSLVLWTKANNNQITLFEATQETEYYDYQLWADNSGVIYFEVYGSGGMKDVTQSFGTAGPNGFHLIVAKIVPSEGKGYLSIDGQDFVATDSVGTLEISSTLVTVGGFLAGSTMSADEVMWFPYALTQNDVAYLWASASGKFWPFESQLFAPSFAPVIAVPIIGTTAAFYVPTITTGAVAVTGTHIATTEALYEPTVTPAAGPQDITGATLASGFVLFVPEAAPGSVEVATEHVASSASLNTPGVAPGAVSVTGSTLASGATVEVPTVTPGPVEISGEYVASGSTVTNPTLAYAVTAMSLESIAALSSPAITVGSVEVVGATLESSAVLNTPVVSQGAIEVEGATIGSGSQVSAPEVAPGAVSVSGAAIESGLILYEPSTSAGAVEVTGDHLGSSAATYEPSVAVGPLAVTTAHIASSLAIQAPDVAQTVEGATLGSAAASFAPTLVHEIAAATLASTAVCSEPSIAVGSVAIGGATLASGSAVHVPAVAVEVVGSTIASGLTLYSPACAPGAVTIWGEHITSGVVLLSPTVAPAGAMIDGATIASGSLLFVPGVAPAIWKPVSRPGRHPYHTDLPKSLYSTEIPRSLYRTRRVFISLPEGLTRYWPMQESTDTARVDIIAGKTLNYSGPASVPRVAGKKNYGAQVPCSNIYPYTGGTLYNGSLGGNTTAHTISAWVSFTNDDDGVGIPPLVFGHLNELNTSVRRSATAFALHNAVSTVAGTAGRATGTFYNLVYTYDGVNAHNLYVNGVLDASLIQAASAGSKDFMVGPPGDVDSPGTQIIDELMWFSRVLSLAEIAYLFNDGEGRFWPFAVEV